MRVSNILKNDSIQYLKEGLFGESNPERYDSNEEPLRSDLFSSDQMEQHGKKLAGLHVWGMEKAPDDYLINRLSENESILINVRNLITESVREHRQITPAGEWLLDNFYLIEENISSGKRHFPKGYSKELPRLKEGPSTGLPRVYDIAVETISHGDGRVDSENLGRFIASYQTVSPLRQGELWAIPIMLRLALIENLRRISTRIADNSIDSDLAAKWAEQMMTVAEKDPKNLILVIADMARSNPPMTTSFVSEFVRQLQGKSPALALSLNWIEQELAESGFSIDRLIRLGNQELAADQLSISNSIDSLRFLLSFDWKEFFEEMSFTEQILRQDPADIYSRMDFATRDQYRHIVEKLSRICKTEEIDVAEKAILLSRKAAERKDNEDRKAHVGFYLIDKGLTQLKALLKARSTIKESFTKGSSGRKLFLFIGSIVMVSGILTLAMIMELMEQGITGSDLWLAGFLFLLGTSHFAVAFVNWIATFVTVPKHMPRMDFSHGIPPEYRSLVVIPSMLNSREGVNDLIEKLEIRFLANRDKNLHFALLTDFKDAESEHLADDELLLELAVKNIRALNDKYKDAKHETFFLLHRKRLWNKKERRWMGYERKRGKLEELNSFLRGSTDHNFTEITGNTRILSNVKYVITLDTDTQLPRDTARQFVATMAHPLNRPVYDSRKKRITEGYGILQPRMAVSFPSGSISFYAKLFGNDPGMDPYTRSVSDVYQDLFGEGSFIGKGVYDVDAIRQVLSVRLPENRILSHDLLEGCYVRSGLLSDVLLFEEYPGKYLTDVKRRHRWIRGDWQIVSWLFPVVPLPGRKSEKNPLSGLSLWKISDNLRRSLVPLALFLILLLGWAFLSNTLIWTLAVLAIIFMPAFITSLTDIFNKQKDVLLRQHLSYALRSSSRHLAQTGYFFISLPYEAFYGLDAILRTLWRLIISRRNLLEWDPSDGQSGRKHHGIRHTFSQMWISPVAAFISIIAMATSRPILLTFLWPIPVLWAGSPLIAWMISNTPRYRKQRLKSSEISFLREISRKTWAYFEEFVSADDNWLPPDNYQENPSNVIAHRTSPTNIGLALLANFSAYDFGYIATDELLNRTRDTLETMNKMSRYRGHFFNWYNTKTLDPLQPLYVSSVDSGNLAGYLIVLKSGLAALPDKKIIDLNTFDAIDDTLRILSGLADGAALARLNKIRKELKIISGSFPSTLTYFRFWLVQLEASAQELAEKYFTNTDHESSYWAKSLHNQCRKFLDELAYTAPWITMPVLPGDLINNKLINKIPTLKEISEFDFSLLTISVHETNPEVNRLIEDLKESFNTAKERASERIIKIRDLESKAWEFTHLEYDFIYNKSRNLLSIGYNVNDRQKDSSYYDLLASEARFATFVAIAQGQLPQESWFSLGRILTAAGNDSVLMSWSGSMFEYLMPLLVMPNFEDTLLDQTYRMSVKKQIEYGNMRNIPWGISESGYNMTDVNLNYQYRAFGVPGMGLKRGLADDLVIAPYATVLALIVDPEEACENLRRLVREDMLGKYGFYEAADYTPARLPRGQSKAVIQSFMAHHEGMSLLALAYQILDRPMQKRFESDPLFRSAILLLQEKIPPATGILSHISGSSEIFNLTGTQEMPLRALTTPDTPIPEVHLLSNGRYNVMVTNAGGGYSKWKNISVTRWKEDMTMDNWGAFCYIRDIKSGEFWSVAYQPVLRKPDSYEAIFSKGRAEFRRLDNNIDTHTEIVVSPEDDMELRRIRITNRSKSRKLLDLTSYAEVVLNSAAADDMHPAFSNLFIQTEIIESRHAILCTRRPRSQNEKPPWMFHLMSTHAAESGPVSYETDRMKFIGRGRNASNPLAMNDISALSGSQGSVLDPVVAIRFKVDLDPEESTRIDIVTGICDTREEALSLIEKYQERRLANRVFELAWTYSQVILRQINASEADAQLYGKLASSILYSNSSLRAESSIIIKNTRGQSGLWGYSISGDLPVVLLLIEDSGSINLVRQMVQAHAYWRLKGLYVDLVILNEDRAGYRQLLNEQIMGLIAAGLEAGLIDRPGGIYVRLSDQVALEDRILIQTVARLIISDKRGTLSEQVNRRTFFDSQIPMLRPSRQVRSFPSAEIQQESGTSLELNNGYGGFTGDGREYIIRSFNGEKTPLPWVNVIANPHFGTVISESGMSYTWVENAHEIRLTPWNNDPVSDSGGEAIYIRDEESGFFWSPVPGIMTTKNYTSRHGFGYSIFEHDEEGIHSELWVYVAIDAPVKFMVLKLKNRSGRPRRLSVTGYVEWVLGDLKPKYGMHIVTLIDPNTGALYARNHYNTDFSEKIAFLHTDDTNKSYTCDRTEFIGRNGSLSRPAGMLRTRLSGKNGTALDPCAAIQVTFDLAPQQERETIFKLGAGRDAEDTTTIINRFRGSTSARNALESASKYWKQITGSIRIDTPDQAVNILTNGWLVYQTIACRMWARTGFYQSGGAYGFRDQLQDAMSLIHTSPQLVREHLLLCASRQFREGDVQHWWHPPSGRGVRTHCSDDYLWLPIVTCRYVIHTGDKGILEEQIPFLEGPPVRPEDDSYYDMPARSEEVASLYQHCIRAILNGLKFGEHGIPLMGTGDWNDGMNLVGNNGKGESVWLGFFLYDVLIQFNRIAKIHGDVPFADKCKNVASTLRKNIEKNCWDGEWYIRAWFDNGKPLGSSGNDECRIDSIAQSWSVLSGAGEEERVHTAMESVNKHLVRRDSGIIQLLDPPFDKSDMDPGYIKGYVPGVRENGGQYTHAAIWAAMAYARLGNNAMAWELVRMMNPLNHAMTKEEIELYKAEPYVMAADIYAVSPHTGRGGWTWYTGSAGLMYRLITESLIGLRLKVDKLYIEPCLPDEWDQITVKYLFRETNYNITIMQHYDQKESKGIKLDDEDYIYAAIPLVNDLRDHNAIVRL